MHFVCCMGRGGTSKALPSKLCAKNSDIPTFRQQIYLRSVNTKSDRHRSRINKADRFSMAPDPKAALRRAVAASNHASVSIGGPSIKEEVASVQ